MIEVPVKPPDCGLDAAVMLEPATRYGKALSTMPGWVDVVSTKVASTKQDFVRIQLYCVDGRLDVEFAVPGGWTTINLGNQLTRSNEPQPCLPVSKRHMLELLQQDIVRQLALCALEEK